MNLYKIYHDICNRGHLRGTKKVKGYELHHILPKSMNGTNDQSNLCLLTPKEHYVVHHCLARTGNMKMIKAFWLMTNTRCFKLTAKQYNEIKVSFSNTISNLLKGIKRSNETKELLRLNSIGNKNMLGKHHSDETKLKLSLINTGKKRDNSHCVGKLASQETREKMSLSRKGKKLKPWTEERKHKFALSLIGKKRGQYKRGIK